MKNNEVIRIAIAETSVIIRGGLTAALKRLPNATYRVAFYRGSA